MADPDLSSLSDEQLQQLHLQSLSDGELKALYQPPPNALTEQQAFAKGGFEGLGDIPYGIEQLAAHGAAAIDSDAQPWANDADAQIATREAAFQKQFPGGVPAAAKFGRVIAPAVAEAPVAYLAPGAAAESVLARMASGTGAGAIEGATQPVNPGDDFWSSKAKQAGAGAAGGALGPVVPSALGRIVAPKTNPDVKMLMDAGVTPTPGQIMGGTVNRIEEAAQSIPLVGDFIKSARGRAVTDFNRSALNQTLAPIGESLDPNTPMGRDAVGEAAGKISDAYDALLPTLKVQADPQFVTDMKTLASNAAAMPPERAAQFQKILATTLGTRFSPGGGMTGQSYKNAESALGDLASDYSNSAVADERQLGGALKQAQTIMRGLLVRSNPDKAPQLAAVNSAYANLLRVQGAAGRIGSDQGVFTPAQLLSSTRQLDPSLRKGAFAKGDALMQDYADAGKSVLGNKVPDSGTPLRGAVMAAGALGPLAYASPAAATGVAGAGIVGAGMYTKPAQRALATLLASRPDAAVPLASLVRRTGPLATSALAHALATQGAAQ